ncbi:MarR family transcriptional regulator [Deinococcus sonorensis]|uniref:MarR family transcriptional regulator n=2 Tax=Deinococcus sonorensis TaxID=309891 RepID=A0AAU7U7Q8_9DEIO
MKEESPTLSHSPEVPAETPLAAQLGHEMKTLHRYISSRVMGAMQEQLHDDELSFRQMGAMHQLRAHAPLSVSRLAELTGLSLSATSHMTDRLVQRGYAERRENPEDRRAKLLALTPRGLELVSGMDRRFTDAYREAFAHVSPDAIQAAIVSIQAIIAELRSEYPDLSPCQKEQP